MLPRVLLCEIVLFLIALLSSCHLSFVACLLLSWWLLNINYCVGLLPTRYSFGSSATRQLLLGPWQLVLGQLAQIRKMAPNMTNQQRFDWIDQQLGELAGLADMLQDLSVKVEALEGLDERVWALEKGKKIGSTCTWAPDDKKIWALDNDIQALSVTVNELTKDFRATVECGVHCPTTIEGIETNRYCSGVCEEVLSLYARHKGHVREGKTLPFPWRIEAVGENKAARTKNPDLASAQTPVEHLTNYIFDESSSRKSQSFSGGNNNKPFKQNQNKSGGVEPWPSSSSTSERRPVNTRDSATFWPVNPIGFKPRPIACFLCNAPHRVAECPYK